MSIEITMPALSPTMEEGTLAKWLVKPGDTISSGDVIAEIETDKATMEVEAVDEGVLAKILVEGGTENVKVNSVIAILAEDGEDAGSVEAPAAKPAEAPAPEASPAETEEKAPAKKEAPEPVALPSAGTGDDRIKASPLARRIAAQKGVAPRDASSKRTWKPLKQGLLHHNQLEARRHRHRAGSFCLRSWMIASMRRTVMILCHWMACERPLQAVSRRASCRSRISRLMSISRSTSSSRRVPV